MIIISKIFTNDIFYKGISKAINSFNTEKKTYYPNEMSSAILNIATKRSQLNGNKWYPCVCDYPTSNMESIAVGNGMIIGVSKNKLIKTYDGIQWQRVFDGSNISKIAFGNGTFVAFSSDSSKGWASKDGNIWTQCCNFSDLADLVFYYGVFVALPKSGVQDMRYSADGIHWNLCSAPPSSGTRIFTANGFFFIMDSNRLEFSRNGSDWSVSYAGKLPYTDPDYDPIIDYHNGVWALATKDHGIKYCSSRLPDTWENTNSNVGEYVGVKCLHDGLWFAVLRTGLITYQAMSSKDGKQWNYLCDLGNLEVEHYTSYFLNGAVFLDDTRYLRVLDGNDFVILTFTQDLSFTIAHNNKIYRKIGYDWYNATSEFLTRSSWHKCDVFKLGRKLKNYKNIVVSYDEYDTPWQYSYLSVDPPIKIILTGDRFGYTKKMVSVETSSGSVFDSPGTYFVSRSDNISIRHHKLAGSKSYFMRNGVDSAKRVDNEDYLYDVIVSRSVSSINILANGSKPVVVCDDELLENFSDNEWSAIVNACKHNVVPETWGVGNTKSIVLKDGNVINSVIIGKNRDNAHLTISFTTQFSQRAKLNDKLDRNNGGWVATDFYNNRITPSINTYRELLPDVIKNSIIPKINKFYSKDQVGNAQLSQSVDNVWLFSLAELFQTLDGGRYYNDEGTWYPYWTSETRSGINEFWTRTPQKRKDGGEHRRYCTVSGDGIPEHSPYETHSILLGFCI